MLKPGLLNKPLKQITIKDYVKLANETKSRFGSNSPRKMTVKDVRHSYLAGFFQSNGKLTKMGLAGLDTDMYYFAHRSGIKNIKDFSKMKIRDYWEMLVQSIKSDSGIRFS